MENCQRFDAPFTHYVIDDFIDENTAQLLAAQFPPHDSPKWHQYNNVLERKRALQVWGAFTPPVYSFFSHLCSEQFSQSMKELTGVSDLKPDYGLHGAGLHMHASGEHLNVHLDYSIHPQLGMERKFNLILYLTPNWNQDWGGGLELWSNDPETNLPREKIKTVHNKFRRAVVFDTTQNSWHGFAEPIKCPDTVYRKSIAMYYVTTPSTNASKRKRALYAPSENQKDNPEILKFIEDRSK